MVLLTMILGTHNTFETKTVLDSLQLTMTKHRQLNTLS